jgi:hypothetical protein
MTVMRDIFRFSRRSSSDAWLRVLIWSSVAVSTAQ